ncbi:MAG: DNA-3-methyladenine glycosylase [Bacteroidales bacterium]|nr:DNA-3-methyladenine glycosylase [Bacteroidales bacterium]
MKKIRAASYELRDNKKMVFGKNFYLRNDVVRISKDLLGKYLLTKIDGKIITGGIITETEAYAGATDKASHAYNNRRTKRTEIMFHEGGVAYVYFCYGMHSLFNIVTNKKDIPHAILIRAIKPTDGIGLILKRRNKTKIDNKITTGPGTVCQALGINCKHSGETLLSNKIWLEDRGLKINKKQIIAGKRIGVDYAGKDALLKYNFKIPI